MTRGDAYRFALHEVLGHALQYASLAEQAEHHPIDWPRLLSIHCPQQVMFEGLAQVLPFIARPDDELVRARSRLDHYLQALGIALCRRAGRAPQRCPCFIDPATDETVDVLALIIRAAVGDWTGLVIPFAPLAST